MGSREMMPFDEFCFDLGRFFYGWIPMTQRHSMDAWKTSMEDNFSMALRAENCVCSQPLSKPLARNASKFVLARMHAFNTE